MKKELKAAIVVMLVMTFLSCQPAKVDTSSQEVLNKLLQSQTEKANSNAETQPQAQTAEPTPAATNPPQSKPIAVVSGSEETGREYYEANRQHNFAKVASLVSDYSLSFLNMTREGVQTTLAKKDAEGWKMLDYQVMESRVLDSQKALIHVKTKEAAKNGEAKTYDFWAALRRENDQWRMNIGAVIDDMVLNLQPKAYEGVIVQPLQIIRFVDKMRLLLKIENKSTNGCFWGWGNGKLAIIHFSQNTADASGSVKVEPNRVYKNAYIDIQGLYAEYPKSMELINWYWAGKNNPDQPDPESDLWQYGFTLQ